MMQILQNILVSLVAILHLGFLYLEMFLWKTPKGQKIFKTEPVFANRSASLAANQVLYNGFLAAGLFWSLIHSDKAQSMELEIFFLSCVIIAGLFGCVTVSKNIFFIQALPAILALTTILLNNFFY